MMSFQTAFRFKHTGDWKCPGCPMVYYHGKPLEMDYTVWRFAKYQCMKCMCVYALDMTGRVIRRKKNRKIWKALQAAKAVQEPKKTHFSKLRLSIETDDEPIFDRPVPVSYESSVESDPCSPGYEMPDLCPLEFNAPKQIVGRAEFTCQYCGRVFSGSSPNQKNHESHWFCAARSPELPDVYEY